MSDQEYAGSQAEYDDWLAEKELAEKREADTVQAIVTHIENGTMPCPSCRDMDHNDETEVTCAHCNGTGQIAAEARS